VEILEIVEKKRIWDGQKESRESRADSSGSRHV